MAISKGFRYKDKEGKVTDYEYGVNGSNVTQDSEHRLVTDEEKQTWNDKADLEDIPSGSAASHAVANNCTTTAAGSVLDARQGKVLMDKANQLSSELAATKQSFQDGVNALRNKCISCGVTPSENTPTGIANAIQTIYEDRYNAGKIAGATTAITTYQKVGSKIASGTPTNFTYTFSSNKTICVVAVGIYDKDPFALEMWLQGNARITQKEYAKHDPVLYVIWTVEGQAGQSISLTSQAYTNNEHMVEAYIIG